MAKSSEFIIMDYPWTDGITTNQSVSPNKTNFNTIRGSFDFNINALNASGLISKRNYSMNLSGDWIIQFDYYLNDTSYADWFNMFAFGTHNGDGGDSPTAAVSVISNRGVTAIYNFSGDDANNILYHQWHTFTIKGSSGKTEFYLDGVLKNSLGSMDNQSDFYLNGKGGGGEIYSYIRNFKFAIGINEFKPPYNLLIDNIKTS